MPKRILNAKRSLAMLKETRMHKKSVSEERHQRLTYRRRDFRPKFLLFGLQLLLGVGLDLLKRHSRSWAESLRRDRQARHDPSVGTTQHEAAAASPARRQEGQESEAGESIRGKPYLARLLSLLKGTVKEWSRDKCPQLGAGLAYYTVFSLAPLMLVLLAVFGWIYGSNESARAKILDQLKYFLDPSGLKVIQDIADNAAKAKAGIAGAAIGILIALFGASGIFGQLQDALNTIWDVRPRPNQGFWGFIRARFLSFAMVGGVCFLLLVSLTVENLLRGLHNYLQAIIPGGHYVGLAVFYVFDLGIVVLLFAMIFRYLPDAKIAWRDVWTGAGLTAVFFLIGKFLLSLYLSSGAAGSAYGAASSLVALLLWVFYSAQILLFGAEFTKLYANAYGSHVEPEAHAVKVEKREIEIPHQG
jgi:membrane protein